MSNENEVLESLKLSYKIRHNAFHHILAYLVTNDFGLFREKRVDQSFETLREIPNDIARLTPDMIIKINKFDEICGDNVPIEAIKSIIITDISISRTSNLSTENKQAKYKKIKDFLEGIGYARKLTFEVNIAVVAVSPDLSDLEREVYSFLRRVGKEDEVNNFPFADFRLLLNSLTGVQSRLKDNINNEHLINAFFSQEFGTKDGNDEDLFEDILKTRLPKLNDFYLKNITKRNNVTSEYLSELTHELDKQHNDYSDDDGSKLNYWAGIYSRLLEDDDIVKKFSEKDTLPDKVYKAAKELDCQAKKYSSKKIRPSHHIYTPLDKEILITGNEEIDNVNIFDKKEQNQILRMLRIFKKIQGNHPGLKFIHKISESFDKIIASDTFLAQRTMFDNNQWLNEGFDSKLHEEYHQYRERCIQNRTPVESILNYNKRYKLDRHATSLPNEGEVRFYKQKMLKLPHNFLDEDSIAWWEKGHSGKKDQRKVDQKKEEYSCNFEHSEYVDRFLTYLTFKNDENADDIRRGGMHLGKHDDTSRKKAHTLFYNFCMANNDLDTNSLNFYKDEMRKNFKPMLELLEYTNGYAYLLTQTLMAEQLMHYTQFSLPSNTYSFFTTGMHNVLGIVNNSYHDAGKDVGKAFMFIGYYADDIWDNPLFGNIQVFNAGFNGCQKKFFITNWRRLETFKLTFLKDQFCSVLSTSMNSLLRYKGILVGYSYMYNPEEYVFDIVKHHFSLKVLVSLTSNQKIAEMLSDMRYAIMASFSDFSEIEKLVLDKFSPKYSTVMEAWIGSRVVNLAKQIEDFTDKENIRTFFKQPIFVHGKRRDDSIGGKFELPSIWTGVIITDLQDLLDDMFIYVHTLKEPSNIHHENIKAIETILEYQDKYHNLSEKRKKGDLRTFDEIKDFLMSENPIGHISDVVKLSCNKTMSTLKGFDLNLRAKKHFFEKVASITSTKAAIPEYEREIIDLKEKKKTKKEKRRKKDDNIVGNSSNQLGLEKENYVKDYGKIHKVNVSPQLPRNIITDVAKESFLPGNNRSKVHDCLLDVLENNIDLSTVFDVGEWNIVSNNARVVSDICIKAQYGAKREFYVINVGAKCNARILENVFSEICKSLPNEMISVPGDKKMLVMQDYINNALTKKGSDQQVIFVNGDCTKWSAAETMECFMSLAYGLKGFLDNEVIKYLLTTICMWSNKNITIPTSILQNTFFTIKGKTDYLKLKSPVIESDQNFLQGMFNYMSSFKAVCSSNFTKELWKKIFPKSKLEMEHLEHSDDYSLLIVSNDIQEVKKFRTLHRMIMKSHGFNDSVKKTNTQRFLMEFISLVSLNGHMTYPHIKKLKECGMNLGCTGFRDDVDGAMSRVGEAVRVGSVMASAYFMQRSHLYNIARSYSLLPGQMNSIVTKIDDLFRLPVEFFGLPDTHPILSFLTKGLSNNYRILNYAQNDTKTIDLNLDGIRHTIDTLDLMKLLLKITLVGDKEKDVSSFDDFTTGLRLYHPGYLFDIENKLIKKIRSRVKMAPEESTEFWKKHMSYNFIKPQHRKLLVPWMRAMYYKHNFSLAYSRNSRSQITLRLSTFTSKNCLYFFADDLHINDNSKKNENISSIKGYYKLILESLCGGTTNLFDKMLNKSTLSNEFLEKQLKLVSLNCDASISTIYSLLDNSRSIYDKPHSRSTVATLTPVKVNWLTLNNKPDAIIEYIFNYDDFIVDNRMNKGLPSLESDKKRLQTLYGDFDEVMLKDINIIKSVYTDIILSQNKRNLCMTYTSNIQNIEDFVRTHLEFGSVYGIKYSLFTSGATESVNPHTGELFYKRLYTYTRNEYRLLIEDSALVFSLLKHGYKLEDEKIKRCLNNMKVNSIFDIDKNLTLKSDELWSEKTLNDLQVMNCSNNELKIFAFIKSYLKNDVQDIMDLINKDFSYSYLYFKPPQWSTVLCKEAVEFQYQNCLFKAFFLVNNDILVITNSRKKYLLADAYLIAQKLFNTIKLYELERGFGITSLSDINQNKTFREKPANTVDLLKTHYKIFKRMLLEYKIVGCFQYNDQLKATRFKYYENEGYTVFPETEKDEIVNLLNWISQSKFLYSDYLTDTKGAISDYINKKVSVDYDTMSVYNGRRKLFGLPLLACQQSNTTEVIGDFELNGLSLNWWLQDGRIRSLLQKEDISINKNEYDKMINFYIKDDRWMIHAETVKALIQLEKMPTKLLKQVPETIFSSIEERIVQNRRDLGVEIDAFTFLQSTLIKQEGIVDVEDKNSIRTIDTNVDNVGVREESDNINYEEFNMDELDDLLGDMGDVQFVEREDDSDNDADVEVERIIEQSEDSRDTSKDSLINFADFQYIQPVFLREGTVTFGATRTKTLLEEIGDPTRFLIQKMYGTNLQIDHLSAKEKIGLLYKLHQMLICCYVMSDIELFLTVTLINKLITNLKKSSEWRIADDFVCVIDEDNKFDFYLKYVGNLENEQEQLIVSRGGHIKFQRINRGLGSLSRGSVRQEIIDKIPANELEKYYLIPIQPERTLKMLDHCSEVFTIQNFLGVQILFNCYERLFKEPFVRTGFVLEILNELL